MSSVTVRWVSGMFGSGTPPLFGEAGEPVKSYSLVFYGSHYSIHRHCNLTVCIVIFLFRLRPVRKPSRLKAAWFF